MNPAPHPAFDRSNPARAYTSCATTGVLADDLSKAAAELGERLDALEESWRSPSGPLLALGALVREFRTERGLSTRRLAARAQLARSTITRVEAGQLHPRRSMLVALAVALDAERSADILARLVAAATPQMAPDTPGWRRYRWRRIRRGLRDGTIPLPAGPPSRIEAHQRAGAVWGPGVTIRVTEHRILTMLDEL